MISPRLADSVEAFANLTILLTDADLDRAWRWGDYDSEGVRFAFFRVYEELRTLAVKLAQERASGNRPATSAQRILAGYHAAYRDLQAALLGVPVEQFDRAPAEGEWPLRQILAHIVGADAGFYAVLAHALNQLRSGVAEPAGLTQEAYDAILGIDEATEEAILAGPTAALQDFHAGLHHRILVELATIAEDEIDRSSRYWETEPMSVRFRLHRFDSHMRQHTIQIDKALRDLGHGPSEARRLLRLIYAALAEAEGALLGAVNLGEDLQEATARAIGSIIQDITPVVKP